MNDLVVENSRRNSAWVSGSNFPRFDRNLNTGGNNYDETQGVVAHTAIHHSKEYPSSMTLTVVKK